MANYAVFNVRRKHEWLATPLKKKRIKRRSAKRIGQLDAWERRKKTSPTEPGEAAEPEAAAEGN
jgi:hypothetical protein